MGGMPSHSLPLRRDFLRWTSLHLAAAPLAGWLGSESALAAAEAAKTAAASSAELPSLNRFPRMVQEWLVDQVQASIDLGSKRRDALRSEADARAYVQLVRKLIRQSFGPEPEKTPLNARVTSVVERDAYRIENTIFESRPGYLVTGNLYVPKGKSGRLPAVVGVCGHSLNGKAAEAYQSFAQGLARQGYLCFLIDPAGQGERFQFLTPELKSRYGGGVSEHIQAGNQMSLVGEFLGAWFAWDGVRALDYLLSREDVDPGRVGVTGNSGGGTQTTWLCGVEPRWTMAAPACFVTSFLRNAENELPADTEQCPPHALALGLDHSDFLAAMAPKPLIILAKERDFFDARGSEEAFARLKKLYTLLGQPDHIRLHIGPTYHGYTQENREAMYRFFNEQTGASDAQGEPTLTIEKDEVLWCAPKGQVSELKSRTIFSFTAEAAQKLAKSRPSLAGEALAKSLRSLLHLPDGAVQSPPDYRILRTAGARKYPAKGYCTYAVETEPGIQALLTRLFDDSLTSRLPRGQKRAVLYAAHQSADAELRGQSLVRDLIAAEPESAFFACDVRGIGDSRPNTCGVDQFLRPYGNDYFYAAHGLMLDKPVLGQRTFDLLRVIDLLVANGHEEVHLAGLGWGALPATFAALLSPHVRQVTLKHAPVSYADIATTEDYKWPYALLLADVLRSFDLPDCYAALAPKQLRNLEPWTGTQGMDPA